MFGFKKVTKLNTFNEPKRRYRVLSCTEEDLNNMLLGKPYIVFQDIHPHGRSLRITRTLSGWTYQYRGYGSIGKLDAFEVKYEKLQVQQLVKELSMWYNTYHDDMTSIPSEDCSPR